MLEVSQANNEDPEQTALYLNQVHIVCMKVMMQLLWNQTFAAGCLAALKSLVGIEAVNMNVKTRCPARIRNVNQNCISTSIKFLTLIPNLNQISFLQKTKIEFVGVR